MIRRRPVAVYRVIDEDELLGGDGWGLGVDALTPALGEPAEPDEPVEALAEASTLIPARPRLRWPPVAAVLAVALAAVGLALAVRSPPPRPAPAPHVAASLGAVTPVPRATVTPRRRLPALAAAGSGRRPARGRRPPLRAARRATARGGRHRRAHRRVRRRRQRRPAPRRAARRAAVAVTTPAAAGPPAPAPAVVAPPPSPADEFGFER